MLCIFNDDPKYKKNISCV